MPEAYAAATLTGSFGDARAAAARATEAAGPHGSAVQLVRPEVVAGPRHIASAAVHAMRAFAEGRGRTQSLELELLCYLTGQRQIREALARGGLPPGATRAVAVALGGAPRDALEAVAASLAAARSWEIPRAGPEVLAALGAPRAVAGDPELRALERVALLDTER